MFVRDWRSGERMSSFCENQCDAISQIKLSYNHSKNRMTTLSELRANYDAGIDVTQTDPRILFKYLHDMLRNPTPTIQDDMIFLVDRALAPVEDPDGQEDLVYLVFNQAPFKGQTTVCRMLVGAGAPTTHRARDCANSKFDGLWNLVIGCHDQLTYTGPISLMQTAE